MKVLRAHVKAATARTHVGALYSLYRTLRTAGLRRHQALAVVLTTDVEFGEVPEGGASLTTIVTEPEGP